MSRENASSMYDKCYLTFVTFIFVTEIGPELG
jgi:hypothetical protein